MSYIPSRAMPHAAPADDPAPAPPAAPSPREWLTLGGIAALAGLGAATLGAALVARLRG